MTRFLWTRFQRLRGSHRGARAFAVGALAFLMIAVTATPAQSFDTIWTDTFEINPAGRWSPVVFGTGTVQFGGNPNWAHGGSRYAYMRVPTGGANFAGAQRNLRLAPTGTPVSWTACGASIWIDAVSAPALVMLQVRNPGGGPIATRWAFLDDSWPYARVVLDWYPPQLDVVVRAGVQEHTGQSGVTDIRIDDLRVVCQGIVR